MLQHTELQVIGPLLVGLEYISRRFINNVVLDLIVVCIDAPGDWLQSTLKIGSQTAFLTEIWAFEIRTSRADTTPFGGCIFDTVNVT